ncbi:lytic transglycosylase domain-containing protein [Gymnodinialimonas sp. 2305UL16-5]
MFPHSAETATPTSDVDAHIAEAAQRFRIPERWIRAVMQAESAGNARAVSSAGAMGLMQIMPGTWAELRAAHGFGSDPFNRRENILAGTAYLRQMYDQFGAPGFLAAYNAGPGRYAEHLRTGRILPRETRRYVAALSQELGFSDAAPLQPVRTVSADRWQAAPLFAPVSASLEALRSAAPDRTSATAQNADEPNPSRSQSTQPNRLFVSRTGEPER